MPSVPSSEIRLKKAYEFAFSPDSRRLAFMGDRDVNLLNIGTGETQFSIRPIANPSHIDFSPDGRCLVVKGTSGRTVILDANTGALLCDFRNQKEGEGDSALFTACSQFVVSVAWNGVFSVRDRNTGKLVFSQTYPDCQLTELSTTRDRSLFVYSVGAPPRTADGLTPCSIALHRWLTRGTKAEVLPLGREAIGGLQISPSGRFVAVIHGTPPGTLEIYDILRSQTVGQCHWSGSPGCAIAWSRDETTIVTNGDDCFRRYALPSLEMVGELPAQYPCFVTYSTTDELIALGSWKRSLVLPTNSLTRLLNSRSEPSNHHPVAPRSAPANPKPRKRNASSPIS